MKYLIDIWIYSEFDEELMINELADRIIMKVRKLSYPVYKILNQIAFLHCHEQRHLLTR